MITHNILIKVSLQVDAKESDCDVGTGRCNHTISLIFKAE